jgi:hypothetical protein
MSLPRNPPAKQKRAGSADGRRLAGRSRHAACVFFRCPRFSVVSVGTSTVPNGKSADAHHGMSNTENTPVADKSGKGVANVSFKSGWLKNC